MSFLEQLCYVNKKQNKIHNPRFLQTTKLKWIRIPLYVDLEKSIEEHKLITMLPNSINRIKEQNINRNISSMMQLK